jgi:cell wall-associated NlpC family hydrolase
MFRKNVKKQLNRPERQKASAWRLLIVGLTAVFLLPPQEAYPERPRSTKLPRKTKAQVKKLSEAARKRAGSIRRFANSWRGVKYKWGGNTRRGIDCSGYSREMFRNVFKVELPRTTRTQIKLGMNVPITRHSLGQGFEPGDLFFYVDPAGIPNHVVVYMGKGRFTHSAGGRGVVVEGFRALWGRRIVGRRVLIPARGGGENDYLPIPAAPAFVATAVPCPPSIRAKSAEVRRFLKQSLTPKIISTLNVEVSRDICEWRALGDALKKRGGRMGKSNAKVLREHVRWLESIDSFKDEAF